MQLCAKFVVVVAVCFVGVQSLSEEMQELADMLHNTCKDETGVAEDVIKNTAKGEFPEDQTLKCYMKCILVQMASMGDDGMVDVEGTIALLPDEYRDKFAPTVRLCGTKVGADHCDNAFLTNKCWYENNKEGYFLI